MVSGVLFCYICPELGVLFPPDPSLYAKLSEMSLASRFILV